MKRFLLFLLSLLLGIILFSWIVSRIGWEEIKGALLVFTGPQGILIFALTFAALLVGNWKWKAILAGQKINISFRALLGPYLASFPIMFLAPVLFFAGEIFRSYVLRERNLVPFAKGAASVVIDRILEWTAALVVIFFGIVFFLYKIGLPSGKVALIFGGAFLVFVALISFFYFRTFRRESIARLFLRIFGLKNFNHSSSILEIEREIFNFFKFKKRAMWLGLGLSFLKTAILYLRTALLMLFLGKAVGALSVLSILGFNLLAVMLPIPAALGSHEAIQFFAFGALGMSSATAAAFAVIIRSAEILLAFLGIILLLRIGAGLLKLVILKKMNNIAKNINDQH